MKVRNLAIHLRCLWCIGMSILTQWIVVEILITEGESDMGSTPLFIKIWGTNLSCPWTIVLCSILSTFIDSDWLVIKLHTCIHSTSTNCTDSMAFPFLYVQCMYVCIYNVKHYFKHDAINVYMHVRDAKGYAIKVLL